MSHTNLWAPWRLPYLTQLDADESARPPGCFLCQAGGTDVAAEPDDAADRLILLRDDRGVLLLNRYPYTNGHLLAAPSDHVGNLADLTAPQRAGLMELTALGEQLLRTAVDPQGINVGINLGRAAGAGVPGHLHVHLVPRWSGDTNFITVVGQVRVVPQALQESYAHLKSVLAKLT